MIYPKQHTTSPVYPVYMTSELLCYTFMVVYVPKLAWIYGQYKCMYELSLYYL